MAVAFLCYQRPTGLQRALVCWVFASESTGIREKREQKGRNAGKLEPGYSVQFDAAASNQHELEKSIRPTRLLSKGPGPWESVVQMFKAFGKENKKESSRREKWTRVAVCCIRCQINRLWPRDNIQRSVFQGMLIIPDTFLLSLFKNTVVELSLLLSFQVSNEKKERKAGRNAPFKNILMES